MFLWATATAAERTFMKYMKWIIPPVLLVTVILAIALSGHSTDIDPRIEDLQYALGSDDPLIRLGAVAQLGSCGEPAIPAIKTVLTDSDKSVSQAAMRALVKIGGEEAAGALASVLTDKDRYIRTKAVLELSLMGRPALPHLFKVLETEPFPRARLFAAHGISRSAGPGDAPEILERFERQDKATQMHLIIALVRIGDKKAYAGLSHLAKSPDPLVRFYVTNTMAEAPHVRALPIFIDAMDDDSPEVRMWAMFGLEKLNLPESYPTVLAALGDETFYIRKEAAYTLGTLGNQAAIPHLLPRLKDTHYLVRGSAAESLGMLGDPSVIPEIAPLLAEESEAVQIMVSEALARLNDYRGMEKLISILDSPHQLYRKEAYNALKRISNQDFGGDREAWSRWWSQAQDAMAQGGANGPQTLK